MNKVASKPPLGLKVQADGKDPAYLQAVRQLPCVICAEYGMAQLSPTEAHHPIHDRYGNRKAPDCMAIPLCNGHHTGDFDKSKLAIHRGKETWRDKYGADHEYIEVTQDRLAHFFD